MQGELRTLEDITMTPPIGRTDTQPQQPSVGEGAAGAPARAPFQRPDGGGPRTVRQILSKSDIINTASIIAGITITVAGVATGGAAVAVIGGILTLSGGYGLAGRRLLSPFMSELFFQKMSASYSDLISRQYISFSGSDIRDIIDGYGKFIKYVYVNHGAAAAETAGKVLYDTLRSGLTMGKGSKDIADAINKALVSFKVAYKSALDANVEEEYAVLFAHQAATDSYTSATNATITANETVSSHIEEYTAIRTDLQTIAPRRGTAAAKAAVKASREIIHAFSKDHMPLTAALAAARKTISFFKDSYMSAGQRSPRSDLLVATAKAEAYTTALKDAFLIPMMSPEEAMETAEKAVEQFNYILGMVGSKRIGLHDAVRVAKAAAKFTADQYCSRYPAGGVPGTDLVGVVSGTMAYRDAWHASLDRQFDIGAMLRVANEASVAGTTTLFDAYCLMAHTMSSSKALAAALVSAENAANEYQRQYVHKRPLA